ncbi:Cl-channel protein [Rhodofomes roseus]|uniref:Cl-channel protein n=1 Tax=Rhodofomes roseus TaxID=34475 RepID=A0ABQ8K698_9APHY|nr:Cl-channel protein [Rhodofomes roseus]KAH9832582.1 Cl-channel protein [Rhodofomes roseus]
MRGSRPRVKPLDGHGHAHNPSDYDAEQEGLLANGYSTGPIPSPFPQKGKGPAYEEGGVIDWQREEAAERERKRILASHRGFRGLTARLADTGSMWLVIILTGLGIGTAGAWLDVLVRWLGDLRDGRCAYGFFYNQVMCCSGLDPGELCYEWQTWSEYLNIRWILVQSLLQSSVYILLAVVFAGSAAALVKFYAPYAFHTGIPEIKAILSGYVLDSFLSPWTLLIKALGLALAVASGLSLGKEGPLVHVSCCLALLLSKMFKQIHRNEARKRKMLGAAAVAGVSVAFGSPLGGVLFGLEELDTFTGGTDVMWRGFVTSVIAAMALQYIDPFGTSKLVLFQVQITDETTVWRAFELIPWLFLSVLGGFLGSLLIKLNARIAVYRRNSMLNDWPTIEVVSVSAITAAVCYLVVFLRVQSSELVANLFMECDPIRGDWHGLCNATAIWANVFLLILTAGTKLVFTAWTFGMMIPAGIFLPTIAIGACLGRAVGLITQGLHRAYPHAWIFWSCPPEPNARCISPGFYAVIGASAMLGGVTRMTVSLVVILFELTGALSHVLPIMISVMVSKWVGDYFGKEGIYSIWIAMRAYPWLPPSEFRDKGETAADVMKPAADLVVIAEDTEGGCELEDVDRVVRMYRFHGFPVVCGETLVGYATRENLRAALDPLVLEDVASRRGRKCTFVPRPVELESESELVDLSDVLEDAVLQMRPEMPLELIVSTFQKLNLRHILFSREGILCGMVTKTDVVRLFTAKFPYTSALSSKSL